MVKRFPTVRDIHIVSQSYMEKRRGRREIEVTRRERGGIKRGESSLANKQFPMCLLSTIWNPQRSSWTYIEKRRGRKEIEVSRRRKGGIKRRDQSRQYSVP